MLSLLGEGYPSRYYCDICKTYHTVFCQFYDDADGNCFCVTDGDGDIVEKFDSLIDMEKEYPEYYTPPPKKVKVRWHALLNPQHSGKIAVVSLKRGGSWKSGWRDTAILPENAPQPVRDTLNLRNNSNIIEDISSLEEIDKGIQNIGGIRHRNTCVITFFLEEEKEKE